MAWTAVAPLLAASLLAGAPAPAEEGPARVGPGVYRPLYPPTPEQAELEVPAFLLDRRPATNAEFLRFVRGHPRWQRQVVPTLFADEGYLSHWAGPLQLGPAAKPEQPVTRVSWFAAAAFCESRGARLPTVAEWELAAAADETRRDASRDPAQRERILSWYSRPTPAVLPPAGSGPANVWGVRGLHGLVWEWVEDFNSELVSSDNREQGGADRSRFCGAAALSAREKEDYAAFMRIAFRSSLQGRSTTPNLGLRCARDLEDQP